MAILDKFTVEVMIDGKPANEYDDDEEQGSDPHSITKYIEAVSGAVFSFKIHINASYTFHKEDTIEFRVFLDGKDSGGLALRRQNFRGEAGVHEIMNGIYVGPMENCKLCRYTFADLETSTNPCFRWVPSVIKIGDSESNDNASLLKVKYEKLGCMRLEFWKAHQLGDGAHISSVAEQERIVVPEKVLKGKPLNVATQLKAPAPAPFRPTLRIQRLDDPPLATFHFKYRTRDALQSLGVVERSPTPVPLEERPLEELSPNELKELVRRQRASEAIKRETQRVKRERSDTMTLPARPLKTTKGSQGQTVYHVDSDSDDNADYVQADPEKEKTSTADEGIEVVTL